MIFKENRPLKGRFLLNGGVQEKSNPRRRPADRADNELGAEIRFCANSRDKIILTLGQVYFILVEYRRFELLTSSLPAKRSSQMS